MWKLFFTFVCGIIVVSSLSVLPQKNGKALSKKGQPIDWDTLFPLVLMDEDKYQGFILNIPTLLLAIEDRAARSVHEVLAVNTKRVDNYINRTYDLVLGSEKRMYTDVHKILDPIKASSPSTDQCWNYYDNFEVAGGVMKAAAVDCGQTYLDSIYHNLTVISQALKEKRIKIFKASKPIRPCETEGCQEVHTKVHDAIEKVSDGVQTAECLSYIDETGKKIILKKTDGENINQQCKNHYYVPLLICHDQTFCTNVQGDVIDQIEKVKGIIEDVDCLPSDEHRDNNVRRFVKQSETEDCSSITELPDFEVSHTKANSTVLVLPPCVGDSCQVNAKQVFKLAKKAVREFFAGRKRIIARASRPVAEVKKCLRPAADAYEREKAAVIKNVRSCVHTYGF